MCAGSFLFFENAYGQSAGTGSADISISVSTPVPQFSLSGGAGQLEVRWNWDFISPGYYPPPIAELRVEISNDALNYGNLQVHSPSDFLATYSGLPAGSYSAQITIIDGNDYDYIVGPIAISGPPSGGGGGGRSQAQESTQLTLSGMAYPGPSTVVIFTYEGGFETTLDPDESGNFSYQTSTLPVGTGTFSFSAKDPDNVLSAPVSFSYYLPANTPVAKTDIYLPPTIRINNAVATAGEVIQITGYAYRNSSVSLDLEGPSSRAYLVQANSLGFWSVPIDSTDLNPGTYNVSAQATSSGGSIVSPVSEMLVFQLVAPVPAPPVCGNGTVETPEQCDDGNAINGDLCSSSCRLEASLPQSSISQPSTTRFTSQPIRLDYTASSPNGAITFVEVYYSRNGGPYVVYPESFISGIVELSGLLDGDYEVYSIARDSTGAIESPPALADATFEIDQVLAFNVVAYPEKRSPPQGNWALPARLSVYTPGTTSAQYTFDLNTDSQGRADVEAAEVELRNYHFVLKGLSHLSKRLNNKTFTGVDLLLDFTLGGTFYLWGGDVHSTKDDYVNGLDISATVVRLYSSFLDADLNLDGFVNGMDLSIIIGNLYRRGEGI